MQTPHKESHDKNPGHKNSSESSQQAFDKDNHSPALLSGCDIKRALRKFRFDLANYDWLQNATYRRGLTGAPMTSAYNAIWPHCGLNDLETSLYPAGSSNSDSGTEVVFIFVTEYVAASPISMRNVTL